MKPSALFKQIVVNSILKKWVVGLICLFLTDISLGETPDIIGEWQIVTNSNSKKIILKISMVEEKVILKFPSGVEYTGDLEGNQLKLSRLPTTKDWQRWLKNQDGDKRDKILQCHDRVLGNLEEYPNYKIKLEFTLSEDGQKLSGKYFYAPTPNCRESGEIILHGGKKTKDITLKKVPDADLKLISIIDAKDSEVHLFGPPEVTLFTSPFIKQDAPIYALKFDIGSDKASGTVRSDDSDILEFVKEEFTSEDANNNIISRRFVLKDTDGIVEISVNLNSATGRKLNKKFRIMVQQLDLEIEGVPDYAEFDIGGIVRLGEMKKLNLTFPKKPGFLKSQEVYIGLKAPEGMSNIEIWTDNPVELISLPVKWTSGDAPKTLYVKGIGKSTHFRDIRLVLTSTTSVEIMAFEEVRLTVVDLDINFPGITESQEDFTYGFTGMNDNDDNGNGEKDLNDITSSGKADPNLQKLNIKVDPPLPLTFGKVELQIQRSSEFSIWNNNVKDKKEILIDGLSQNKIVRLEPSEQMKPVYLEGLSDVHPPGKITLELFPQLLVDGSKRLVGFTIKDQIQVVGVQVDINIVGVPDEGNDEYQKGGIVKIVEYDTNELDEENLTELTLKLSPNGIDDNGKTKLSIVKGLKHIKLWKKEGGEYQPLALEVDESDKENKESTASIEFPNEGFIPSSLFVQGIETSEPKAVEIELAYFRPDKKLANFQSIHTDKIRLTVEDHRPPPVELELSPGLIVVPYDPRKQEAYKELQVRMITTHEGKKVDVTTHDETHYHWIQHSDLINRFDPEIPIANIHIDEKGKLKITSPGVQLIQATYGESKVKSNFTLVLAGIELKDIKLKPESFVSTPIGFVADDPWLILTSVNNGLTNKGFIHLEDVTFETIGGGYNFNLKKFGENLKPIEKNLNPKAKVFIFLAKGILKYIGTQALTFDPQNNNVVTVNGASDNDTYFTDGVTYANQPGITGITATLDLSEFDLGKADGTVIAWVLPTINKVEIVTPEDPPNIHTGPIPLYIQDPPSPPTVVKAWVDAEITKESRVQYNGSIKSVLGENFVSGSYEREFEFKGIRFKVTGTIENQKGTNGKSALLFKNFRLSFYAPNIFTKWESNKELYAKVLKSQDSYIAAEVLPNEKGLTGKTRIFVKVDIPGLTSVEKPAISQLRQVIIKDTECRVGYPISHLGEVRRESIIQMDNKFVDNPTEHAIGSPFSAAFRKVNHPLAKAINISKARTGLFPENQLLSKIGPWSAGWIYFIEYPVNDPELCICVLQESSTETDSKGRDVRNRPIINQVGASISYVAGQYKNSENQPLKFALVFAKVRGWANVKNAGLYIERVSQRLSIMDKNTNKYKMTVSHHMQLGMDTRMINQQKAYVKGGLTASSMGEVGEEFSHRSPLSALDFFKGQRQTHIIKID